MKYPIEIEDSQGKRLMDQRIGELEKSLKSKMQ